MGFEVRWSATPPRGMRRRSMSLWIRFERAGSTGFGTLEDDTIRIHRGDMFAGAVPTGAAVALS
ncbi:MAG: DUF2437 domain-containing protein, partial [Burkholderiales bacterium]